MSEQASGGAPAPAQPTPAPTAEPQPPVASATPAPSDQEPPWLGPRLDQAKKAERTALLKSLGYATEAEAKAALDAGKVAQQASLTQQERDAARIKELEPVALKATSLESTVKEYADEALATLTEAQRAAVQAIAGDDSARVLTTIKQLRPTWVASAPAAPAAPPPPAPANTAPPGTPPPPKPADPQSPRAIWEAKKRVDPMAASIFYQSNRAAIEATPAS
jgi:hypothetical protein